MEGSQREEKIKKKVTETKTFPVPFTLSETKENISIFPNPHTKPSKVQIVNQAFQFHSQGNIHEAKKYYQYFINQGFKDHIVFSNYGSILKSLGQLEKAALYQRKAIEMKPDFAKAHYNLANTLKGLGELQKAKLAYRKTIEIKPDFAKAHYNLANTLKELSELQEAKIRYRKAIELNPEYTNAHYNLGSILLDLGRLQEAELSTRKAIELNPDFVDAYLNLGNILGEMGKLQEAELSTRKAIELNPEFAGGHFNLGNILRGMGKLQEAELSTRKAIELNPDFVDAYLNLGNILREMGKSQEALVSYLKAIDIAPTPSKIYNSITFLLKESDPSLLNKSKLNNIFKILLEREDINHQELFNVLNFFYKDEITSNLKNIESQSSMIELFDNKELIINALKKLIFNDPQLEKLLTSIRKKICHLVAKNTEEISYCQLQLIVALGEQCYLNEYIYYLTQEEYTSINQIIDRCIYGKINETKIAILSCYFPLYKLLDRLPSFKSFNFSHSSIKELIRSQITEPIKEIELSKSIKRLGLIKDNISQKVKSQYEDNPYPRWLYGNTFKEEKFSLRQTINGEINPNYIDHHEGYEELNILIAGCGTGNQVLQSQRYKNAKITAIDLSLSSLSYAQRKLNEIEINNVELIQMDILEVNLLKKKFDVIECGGVLHHMDSPSKGLKALLGVLNNNGFLKLGLYSELARTDIVKAREYISTHNLHPNDEDIRDFRQKILSDRLSILNSLKSAKDFYSLSECRDLCFHTQEHRFTIQQLNKILRVNQLKFLGFLLPKRIKSLYQNYFPEDKKQTNLENWAEFEEKNPNTFRQMYQFWVGKTLI